MSKIIVRKQEYANNGTHADEIKAVVRDDLITQTLTSDTDLVPSSNAVKDAFAKSCEQKNTIVFCGADACIRSTVFTSI